MAEIDGEGIELTLGLSLNGRFGVDPKSMSGGNLKRSASSVSNLFEAAARLPHVPSTLARARSLPLEADEETRKRKEAQMLRRLEAKRKRSEKQRGGGRSSEERKESDDSGSENLANGVSKQGVSGHGLGSKPGTGNGFMGPAEEAHPPPLSQASSGSSSLTELESQTPPPAGMTKGTEAKSPQSVHSFSEQNESHLAHCSGTAKKPGTMDEGTRVNTEGRRLRSISGTNEMVRDMLADMPCVSTKGDGPNGRRIEGFLYRYRKGEEVRIVCVCHGSFLSPAEFVKHAGGGDVEHPLRRIVVNPAPFV